MRPSRGLQRGSVFNGAGDPRTPGYASTPGAPRIPLEQTALPKIPVVPISAANAELLMNQVRGTDIPANAIIHGAYIKTTTAPTFGGTTTGLNAKIGTAADDDGYGQAISIASTAGIKIPEPGARRGVINTTQDVVVAFTATGGAASLAEVTAGAGTVYIAYSLAPV